MTFKEFKTLVEIHTQDGQSKLPTTFQQWQLIISTGIKKLESELREELQLEEELLLERDNIPLEEDISMALVFDVSQMYTNDLALKQKYVADCENAKGTYLWNKFIALCEKEKEDED